MPSPTFNGQQIFDSKNASDVRFPEGVLMAHDFGGIKQTIHFNGENGNRYIDHGYPDRPWTFRGTLSAKDLSTLGAMFDDIEDAIEDAQAGNYKVLVDSFGTTYAAAQVHSFNPGVVHSNANEAFAIGVVVTGIIQGMVQDA